MAQPFLWAMGSSRFAQVFWGVNRLNHLGKLTATSLFSLTGNHDLFGEIIPWFLGGLSITHEGSVQTYGIETLLPFFEWSSNSTGSDIKWLITSSENMGDID